MTFDLEFQTTLVNKEAAAIGRSVVFLDFDGVIRVAVSTDWDASTAFDFCQKRMEILRKVALITGVRYVVSSDWRHLSKRGEIESHLSPYLAELLHEDWATPVTGHRWNEVQRWLFRHPEVSHYAILDDFAPHFDGCPQAMLDRLLLCTNRHGVTPKIAARLIAMFPPQEEKL